MRLNAEISEVATAGLGGDPLRDFGLNQEHRPCPDVFQFEDLLKNRRRDVVRKIARDDRRAPRGQIDLEHFCARRAADHRATHHRTTNERATRRKHQPEICRHT